MNRFLQSFTYWGSRAVLLAAVAVMFAVWFVFEQGYLHLSHAAHPYTYLILCGREIKWYTESLFIQFFFLTDDGKKATILPVLLLLSFISTGFIIRQAYMLTNKQCSTFGGLMFVRWGQLLCSIILTAVCLGLFIYFR